MFRKKVKKNYSFLRCIYKSCTYSVGDIHSKHTKKCLADKVTQKKEKYLCLSLVAWQPGAKASCCYLIYQSSKKDDP